MNQKPPQSPEAPPPQTRSTRSALPQVGVVQGQVTTSKQVEATNCGLLALDPTGPEAQAVQDRFGIDLEATAARLGFTSTAGGCTLVELPVLVGGNSPWVGLAPTLALLGVADAAPDTFRQVGARLARAAAGRGPVTALLNGPSPAATQAFTEGYRLGAYRAQRRGLSRPVRGVVGSPENQSVAALTSSDSDLVGDLTLLGSYDAVAVTQGSVASQATALARDLINEPSNLKNPAWLAARAQAEAATRITVQGQCWGPNRLAREGLNALGAVGAGAWQGPVADNATSPRLLLVTHTPGNVPAEGLPHLVIVGKGITFDTGGLDLKPTSNMVSMKTDMAGAAVALATVLALADLAAAGQELNLKVTAVLPLAQNAVGAASYRPSDVLTVYGGTRVEVGDTDAEGRLVLADALAFAVDQLDPDYLVDIATLTGAQRVALGDRTGAYFASDEALAQHLEQSGPVAGEDWWRLPLEDAYEELLDTPNADVNSIGREGSGAGAITAALFLRRFTAGRPWLHLDVAGPARATTTQAWTVKGATGFGVRSLIQLAQRLT